MLPISFRKIKEFLNNISSDFLACPREKDKLLKLQLLEIILPNNSGLNVQSRFLTLFLLFV
jgi:hypothetical protein